MTSRSMLPLALLASLVLALAGCGGDDGGGAQTDEEVVTGPAGQPPGDGPEAAPRTPGADALARVPGDSPRVEVVAQGLEVPWEIRFLPDGRALITERAGSVRLLTPGGRLRDEPLAEIQVEATGEGGLLGMAIDPAFADNRFVYLYRTTGAGNEVVRFRLAGDTLREERVIADGIRAAPVHDGGRLEIGPEGWLYVTTGDAARPRLAQAGGLNGKVLRMAPDAYREEGGRPQVFTTGHRNPQGLAFQPGADRVWITEHGPDGDDEVNVLRRGANYGWPEVRGEDHGDFEEPVAVYSETVAPAGATFVHGEGSAWTGDLLFGTLVGEAVRRLEIDGTRVTGQETLLDGEHGRIRTVVEGPDGALYALTSNRDGRGTPREGDDKVLRIVPPAG